MKLSQHTINRLQKAYGDWVLITGATSGIGRELAIKFGEAGFKLIITGRNEKTLEELCTTLFDNYTAEAIPIQGDLSQLDDVRALFKNTDHINIGITVLNAGFGSSGRFIDSNIQEEMNMLNLNCRSVLLMTHYFANKLRDRSKKGAIVYMSSMVAFQGVPNASNYAASKAYVQSLGEGLARELKSQGIDVLCAAPGPVASGFAERANMKMGTSLTPRDIAVPIINAIGKKNVILPGFLTKFLVYNLRLLPRWGKIRVMENVMRGFTKHQIQ